MMHPFQIEMASPPDPESLVACFMLGGEQFADLSQEEGALELEFYSRRDNQPGRVSYDAMIAALGEARFRLGA